MHMHTSIERDLRWPFEEFTPLPPPVLLLTLFDIRAEDEVLRGVVLVELTAEGGSFLTRSSSEKMNSWKKKPCMRYELSMKLQTHAHTHYFEHTSYLMPNSHMPPPPHTHTHKHTYIHAYIHTCTHTQTPMHTLIWAEGIFDVIITHSSFTKLCSCSNTK